MGLPDFGGERAVGDAGDLASAIGEWALVGEIVWAVVADGFDDEMRLFQPLVGGDGNTGGPEVAVRPSGISEQPVVVIGEWPVVVVKDDGGQRRDWCGACRSHEGLNLGDQRVESVREKVREKVDDEMQE